MLDTRYIPTSGRAKIFGALQSMMIEKDSYGSDEGQWSMSELVEGQGDNLTAQMLRVIEGVTWDGSNIISDKLNGLEKTYKLKVMSRQACCRTKDGKTIWQQEVAKNRNGEPGDLVPTHDEPPQPGDIVEWKTTKKTHDERGNPVDEKVRKRWSIAGIRPHKYAEFVVDKDLCINVRYPYVYSMLIKHGFRLVSPQHRKTAKNSKNPRRITNWWFKEVLPSAAKPDAESVETPQRTRGR